MQTHMLRIGVVGFCAPTIFDEVEARRMLLEAYDRVAQMYPGYAITIVSGITNTGVLKIAYEEAVRRGWRTAGVACKLVKPHKSFPVDEKIIVGENWGDESETFIASIHFLIRIGGGRQSKKEVEMAKAKCLRVMEYDLVGTYPPTVKV